MILSDNSIDHALLALGAMHVGVPVAPVSSAYSLLSKDYEKLRYASNCCSLAGVRRERRTVRTRAEQSQAGLGKLAVVSDPPDGIRATAFAELVATTPKRAVDKAFAKVGPDTIAKFCSAPARPTCRRASSIRSACCAPTSRRSLSSGRSFGEAAGLVIVDWLPWNHTFGGNLCFNTMLRHGGTLYIDEGKPTPQLIAKTVANLRARSADPLLQCPARI